MKDKSAIFKAVDREFAEQAKYPWLTRVAFGLHFAGVTHEEFLWNFCRKGHKYGLSSVNSDVWACNLYNLLRDIQVNESLVPVKKYAIDLTGEGVKPPAFIEADREPDGFALGPINQATYMGYRYHWNSPCARTGQGGGWSIGSCIEEGTV